MDTRRQLARTVRDTRIERGLTQAEVARALGLHRPAVSEIEAGRRAVSSEELLELSRLFSVSVSDLLPSSPGSSLITPEASPPGPVAPAPLDSASLHLPAAGTSPADATRVDDTIAEMAQVIADLFGPDQILLFGSHARGNPGPDSDVDLLVVMHVEGSRRRMGARVGAALHRFDIPKDVIVTTPRAFAERRSVPGTIERSAAVEGKVLHAAR